MDKNFFEKLNTVMLPMNLSFWKELQEDMGGLASASAACGGGFSGGVATGMSALGAAPCPAMGQITGGSISGAMFNGIPVEGTSGNKKKKKKKSAKNEERYMNDADLEEFLAQAELDQAAEDAFEKEELANAEAFDMEVRGLVVQAQSEENAAIKSYLDKALRCEELGVPTLAKLFKELADDETVHTGCLQSALDNLGLSDYEHVLDGQEEGDEFFVNEYDSDVEKQVESLLNEDFHEEYDEITAQIAKYLDKLNFKYANTDEIIYKKEGEYKYLFKFDNGIGLIKIKVIKDDEILVEKEYKIEETQDIQPIFDEIADIYKQYGL